MIELAIKTYIEILSALDTWGNGIWIGLAVAFAGIALLEYYKTLKQESETDLLERWRNNLLTIKANILPLSVLILAVTLVAIAVKAGKRETIAIITMWTLLGIHYGTRSWLPFLHWLLLLVATAAGKLLKPYEPLHITVLVSALWFCWLAWAPAAMQSGGMRFFALAGTVFLFIVLIISMCGAFSLSVNYLMGGGELTVQTVIAVLETNTGEATEMIKATRAHTGIILLTVLFSALLGVYFAFAKCTNTREPSLKLSGAVAGLILACFNPLQQIEVANVTLAGYRIFSEDLKAYKELKKLRNSEGTGHISVEKTHERKPTVTVLILGESCNKWYMGLYDFIINSTPRLQKRLLKGEIVLFKHVFSSHAHTSPQLAHLLTLAGCLQEGMPWYSAPSILQILRTAGIKTLWLSNQRKNGVFNALVSVLAEEADTTIWTRQNLYEEKWVHYDEVLLPLLASTLQNLDSNLSYFIAIHLMGNHAEYSQRYPPSYHIVEESLSDGAALLPHYINSMFYLDFVVDSILSLLDRTAVPVVAWYVSDHGEEVLLGKMHNSALFDYEMVQIPAFVWANRLWREYHEREWQTLTEIQHNIIPSDHLTVAVLQTAGIHLLNYTQALNPLSHIWNKDNWKRCQLLHQSIPYSSDSNIYVWWELARTVLSRFSSDMRQEIILTDLRFLGDIGFAMYYEIESIVIQISSGPHTTSYPTLPIEKVNTPWLLNYLGWRYPHRRFTVYLRPDNATELLLIEQSISKEKIPYKVRILCSASERQWCRSTGLPVCIESADTLLCYEAGSNKPTVYRLTVCPSSLGEKAAVDQLKSLYISKGSTPQAIMVRGLTPFGKILTTGTTHYESRK